MVGNPILKLWKFNQNRNNSSSQTIIGDYKVHKIVAVFKQILINIERNVIIQELVRIRARKHKIYCEILRSLAGKGEQFTFSTSLSLINFPVIQQHSAFLMAIYMSVCIIYILIENNLYNEHKKIRRIARKHMRVSKKDRENGREREGERRGGGGGGEYREREREKEK